MASKRLISVFTASSNTGRACVRELLERHSGTTAVRAVFRSEEKAAPLRADALGNHPGLEIVSGFDAFDVANLGAAFEGADAAVVVTPHEPARGFGDDAALTEAMMTAAAKAGVRQIVSVGSWTVNAPRGVPALAARFLTPEVRGGVVGMAQVCVPAHDVTRKVS